MRQGFTLIELSIVLVIIGLIVGGVLVGQDLINAAAIRAQITQIEKYNAAVNTFRGKYGYLPGDIPDPTASQYGFASRGQYAGEGDGNGLIEGVAADVVNDNSGLFDGAGESLTFWVDLSQAGLVDGGFSTATPTGIPTASGAGISSYIPPAKIGGRNYVYVWSGGWTATSNFHTVNDGKNYFSISLVTGIGSGLNTTVSGVTVQQAYAIDNKADDGLPQSGNILALFPLFIPSVMDAAAWSAGNGGPAGMGAPYNTATSPTTTTCFDNSGATAPQKYSMGQNAGTGVNCALSFRFK